jgi:ribosome-associated translation inhibitor RaiA
MKSTEPFSIEITGLKNVRLTEHQHNAMHLVAKKAAKKLTRHITEPFKITLHPKTTRAEGKQQQFEVKLRINAPGMQFATQKTDWDIETAVHRCFNLIETKIKK